MHQSMADDVITHPFPSPTITPRPREGSVRPSKWIYNIVVVGFHHTHGNHVESVFPPLEPAAQKEHQWEYLPFLAIPDGSHNSLDDFTFFVLPKTSPNGYDLYGVSCFRQIKAIDLPEEARTADITRTHVQKAVCILSYLPFFGPFNERLSVVTHYYFNQKNFADTEILASLYQSLEGTYAPEKPLTIPDILVGVPLQDLVLKLGRKLLILFKLVLLEQGIVVFSSQPVSPACTFVLGLLSLFPSGVDTLLPDFIPTESRTKHMYYDTSDDAYGLPLEVFHQNCLFYPFITLQQIDVLNKRGVGFLAGTSNMLYIKNPPYSTAAIVELGSGNVSFPNEAFSRLVGLSSSDRRFIDDVVSTVTRARANQSSLEADGTNSTSWEGSDSWIRAQFAKYIHCLLNTTAKIPHMFDGTPVENIELGGLDAYSQTWARAWLGTHNFRKWRRTVAPKSDLLLASAANFHPSGPPSALLDDISDKLSSQLKELEPTLTPLKQGLESLTSSTISTLSSVQEKAIPLKNSLGVITSNTFSNVRTNALSFSKFLSDSADTFVANYNGQLGTMDRDGSNRQRSNSAATIQSNQQAQKQTRSHSIAVAQHANHDNDIPSIPEDDESFTTTTTSTTSTTSNTPTTTATSEQPQPELEPEQQSRHQDSVAAVAKATANVVSTTSRWFSAFSSKVLDTVVSISDAVMEDDPPRNAN